MIEMMFVRTTETKNLFSSLLTYSKNMTRIQVPERSKLNNMWLLKITSKLTTSRLVTCVCNKIMKDNPFTPF